MCMATGTLTLCSLSPSFLKENGKRAARRGVEEGRRKGRTRRFLGGNKHPPTETASRRKHREDPTAQKKKMEEKFFDRVRCACGEKNIFCPSRNGVFICLCKKILNSSKLYGGLWKIAVEIVKKEVVFLSFSQKSHTHVVTRRSAVLWHCSLCACDIASATLWHVHCVYVYPRGCVYHMKNANAINL